MKPGVDMLEQSAFIDKVRTGYTQHFCTVIYARIEHCVSLQPHACSNFVKPHIQTCISEQQTTWPDAFNPSTYKQAYQQVGACLQQITHDDLVNRYLLNTKECQELMQ